MVSKVFDTSKDIAKGGLLPLIYNAMRVQEKEPDVLQELLGALKVRTLWPTLLLRGLPQ